MKGYIWLAALVAFWLIVAELVAREAIDLRLYNSDHEVGYWLRPSQHGDGLLTGSYAIDADGLGVPRPFAPTRSFDLLLVGDSIVMGTSSVDQEERLGPQLEKLTGWSVWPLSAGSWALWNEIRSIERNPKLLQADAIVFVLNSEDFRRPSFWDNEFEHPRHPPASYLVYAVQKMLRGIRPPQHPLSVRQSDLAADWAAFRARADRPILVIGYENMITSGSGCTWLPKWLNVTTACYDPMRLGGRKLFADQTHPTAAGNTAFARFIRAQVERGVAPQSAQGAASQ
ncbi:MAG: hypothetical protein ACTHK5_07110 [Tsuneonella sp.]